MDIYTYLKKDHKKVADLMDQVLETKDSAKRESLFQEIKIELTLHADTEKATFYKAIQEATRSKAVDKQMDRADEEHDEIRGYLEKLSTLSVEDEAWIEQFGEFKHAVSHHVEEEEGDIFEKAKQYFSAEEAKELATRMDALKKEQESESAAA